MYVDDISHNILIGLNKIYLRKYSMEIQIKTLLILVFALLDDVLIINYKEGKPSIK